LLKNTHPHTHLHIQQNIYNVANSCNNYECVKHNLISRSGTYFRTQSRWYIMFHHCCCSRCSS